MVPNLLTVNNLTAKYHGSDFIFTFPDFKICQNECLGILGPSGMGKTSMLNSLFQLNFPGKVSWTKAQLLEKELPDYSFNELYKEISYLPQFSQNALNPSLTIKKQMQLIMDSTRSNQDASFQNDWNKIVDWMVDLRLTSTQGEARKLLSIYPHQLSGGMKQRMALLLGFIKNPSLYVIDEPSSGIDAITQNAIFEFLVKNKQDNMGMGIILVSHEKGFVEALADKILVLEELNCIKTAL